MKFNHEDGTLYAIHRGVVTRGFQIASGDAVGRATAPSPFPEGALALQRDHFAERGVDLAKEIPSLFWGTINVEISCKLVLDVPDFTITDVDWTKTLSGDARLTPETFSFIRCCFVFDGAYHTGLLYYPHPETKLPTNRHNFDVLEVLTHRVEGLHYGAPAAVVCRSDAFRRI